MALDEGTSRLFIGLVTFWILILMLSAFTGVSASKSGIPDTKDNGIVTLLKIMTFQYAEVPPLLSIFLISTAIFTIFIGYLLVRG